MEPSGTPLLRAARLLAGLLGREVLEAWPLSAESRNAVARVALDGGEVAILKFYEPDTDTHAANRFRREEKVLTLLGTLEPPVAPRPLGGFLPARGAAMLLMEDAGASSLADGLAGGQAGAWQEAAAFLERLHAGMRTVQGPLKATAMAVDLDRISDRTLARRLEVAFSRILGRPPDPGFAAGFADFVAPLLEAPAAMIHNSLSPLNVVTGPRGLRAIDWETLTWGSPLWDWAELLRAPYAPLPLDAAEAMVARAVPAPDTMNMYRRALVSRHLDSLATVVLRRRAYLAEGRADRAAEYARRADFYASDIAAALDRAAAPPELARGLEPLLRARTSP